MIQFSLRVVTVIRPVYYNPVVVSTHVYQQLPAVKAVGVTGEQVTGTWTTNDGDEITGTYLTPAGMAAMLDVTRWNVLYHIRAGHIPTSKVGQLHLIALRDANRIARNYRRGQPWPKPLEGKDCH